MPEQKFEKQKSPGQNMCSKSRRIRNQVAPQYEPQLLNYSSNYCFVHPILVWSFGFWYFGHFSCVIFFSVFFHLAHLVLQNVNKEYIIFLYFCNFIAQSDQKRKWDEPNISVQKEYQPIIYIMHQLLKPNQQYIFSY